MLYTAAEGKKNKGATEKKNNLPKNLSIRATHFINIRPSAGIHVGVSTFFIKPREGIS